MLDGDQRHIKKKQDETFHPMKHNESPKHIFSLSKDNCVGVNLPVKRPTH